MYIEYLDIRERITERPSWWIDGVPRYGDFSPKKATVYGHEVLLVRAACQACHHIYDIAHVGSGRVHTFRDKIDEFADVEIGDPPNACCEIGATMQAEALRVLQFWERGENADWHRVTDYERWLDSARHFDAETRLAAEADGGIRSHHDFFVAHDLYDEWNKAWADVNIDKLVALYEQAGCTRAYELVNNGIAHREHKERQEFAASISRDQRERARWLERMELRSQRLEAIKAAKNRYGGLRGLLLAYADNLIDAVRRRGL